MGEAISKWTATVLAGEVQGPAGLRLVPILGPSQHEPGYQLLEDEVLKQVTIGEVSEGGDVPTLRVTNPLDERLFLMDGQELVGAKQNRILNTDVLVPAQSKLEVPVSCVERGRWQYRSRHFQPGGSASFRMRRRKSRRVHESLQRDNRFDADQGAVWEEVDQELSAAATSSDTDALSDVYAARQQELDALRQSFSLPEEAVGLAVFHGAVFQGLDLFDRHATLVYFWRSLVDSYALGWLSNAEQHKHVDEAPHEAHVLDEVLDRIAGATWQHYASPGEGVDHRLEHEAYTGSALSLGRVHGAAHERVPQGRRQRGA